MISKSLQKIDNLKHGSSTELLVSNNENFKCVGQYNFGNKFGQWTILNNEGEIMYLLF